ncbi:MAG: ATP-binding protein, partial [Bacteroidia bacterium]|nr:ATP-binding protein [Bacteroidia bacterium]
LEKYLQKGGFPEFLLTENTEILQNLLKDIVLRDIAIRYGIRNTKMLMDIVLFLISNVGKETTYNSLKKVFGAGSANTIMDYLGWLEDAYLLFFVQKFSWSAKIRAVNPRKIYAIDTGFINANSLSFTSDYGRLLENTVAVYFRSNGIKVYYFKEKYECDFILFKGTKCLMAVQVCYNLNTDNMQREINGLAEALDFFDLKEGYIVTLNQTDTLKAGNKKINIVTANSVLASTDFIA